MRTLLFAALLVTAAQAQVQIVPEVDPPTPAAVSLDCDQGAEMAIPLSPAPEPVPIPDLALAGPPPVPMPNVCADAARVALRPGLDRFPVRPRDRFRDLPGAPRGLRDADPFTLRDRWTPYPDLHDRPLTIPEFRAPVPEIEVPGDLLRLPPVAPLGDHE